MGSGGAARQSADVPETDPETDPRPERREGPLLVPHSWVEDVFGTLTGTYVVSFGIFLLGEVGAATGGVAGLSLVFSYTGVGAFGAVFLLVNLPFFALAWFRKGPVFTLRSAVCVALVAGFSFVHPRLVDLGGRGDLEPAYAVLTGDLLIGIGLLIVFRHGASLGGFNVVSLLAQERFGWRAGYVQMALDVAVVLSALAVADPVLVLISAGGAVVLNLVLALNHRPGRYLGA